jgi:uncharacterized membrane protein
VYTAPQFECDTTSVISAFSSEEIRAMSEPNVPPPPTPPPTPPPAAPTGGSSNKTLMLVLSYLFPLSLIPLLTEKEDADVQWHAKHGIVLGLASIAIWVVFGVLNRFVGGLGCFVAPFLWLAILIVFILAIVKAVNGQRFKIPGISDFADKF